MNLAQFITCYIETAVEKAHNAATYRKPLVGFASAGPGDVWLSFSLVMPLAEKATPIIAKSTVTR